MTFSNFYALLDRFRSIFNLNLSSIPSSIRWIIKGRDKSVSILKKAGSVTFNAYYKISMRQLKVNTNDKIEMYVLHMSILIHYIQPMYDIKYNRIILRPNCLLLVLVSPSYYFKQIYLILHSLYAK